MRKWIINDLKKKRAFKLKGFGNSMVPLIHEDDILEYKKIEFKNIKTNDIVLVSKNNQLFTHRVIYRTSEYAITKGDNNLQSDGKVFSRNIIGKLIAIERQDIRIPIETFYLAQSTLYFKEIVKVKKLLERRSISFLFLKGLPLHLYYEGTHPKRIYVDCDVLVTESQYSKVARILKQAGYRQVDQKKEFVEETFVKVIHGLPILFDIHKEVVFMMTQLTRLNSLYSQQNIHELSRIFLKEKRDIKVLEENFPTLSGENLTLYLLLHFFHHNFRGIHRLELLAKVCQKEKISNILIERVKIFKLQSYVVPAVCFLLRYFHAPKLQKIFKEYLKDYSIDTTGIFTEETRVVAGITRIKNLLLLSPRPLIRKMGIIFNLSIYRWILIVCFQSVRKLLRHQLQSTGGKKSYAS